MSGPRSLSSERGSLPLAMLAMIIMTALISVMVATVISGERYTAFDTSYEQALQVAEVGLDRLIVQVEDPDVSEDDLDCATDPTATVTHPDVEPISMTDPGTGEQVEATAVYVCPEKRWVVQSTGTTPRGEQRTVQSTVEISTLFDVAAFGKFGMSLNGNNRADSFRSGEFTGSGFVQSVPGSTICPDNSGTPISEFNSPNSGSMMCNGTGKGILATNGTLFLRGQVYADSDIVQVHNARERIPDPLPDATGYCDGANTVCSQPNAVECSLDAPHKLQFCRDPIVLPYDPVQAPWEPTTSFGPASSSGGCISPATNCLAAGVHVFTDLELDSDTVIQGTPDEPTVIYLTGRMQIGNGEHVNMEVVSGRAIPRPAPSLLIFSAGTGPAIDFGNHVYVSAGIFAPNAAFSGGAVGNIYGSLVTGSMANVGAWRFHYDEALGDVTLNFPKVAADWSEVSNP